METNKTGAFYAVIIGLPAGLVLFSLFVMLRDFFPFSLLLKVSSFRIFWHPFSWLAFTALLGFSLWQCGLRIPAYLQKHDSLRSSFLFTVRLNLRLLIGITVIYIGGIGIRMFTGHKPLLAAIPYGIIAFVALLGMATIVMSISVSLLITELTRKKLNATSRT